MFIITPATVRQLCSHQLLQLKRVFLPFFYEKNKSLSFKFKRTRQQFVARQIEIFF
jgi:hypothetical protein